MTIEEGVKIAGTVIQVIAVVVTAFFASKSLNAWRQQEVGKRKIEIAEEILVAAYKARANLHMVRDRVQWAGEGDSRPKQEGESESDAEWRRTAFVTLERSRRLTDDFAHFEKTKVLAQVHFADELVNALEAMIRAQNEVTFAARLMAWTSTGGRELGPELVRHYQATI